MWRLAWVIVLGAFASGLDSSLVNVGLRTIGIGLHAGLSLVQWVANGYLLALAGSLPLAGWLGRRLGIGRLWLAALAAFTIASALCAVAPTIEALIGLRVDKLADATTTVNIVQRVGGALGGALFTLILANGAGQDLDARFHIAFLAMTATGIIALS